MSFLSHLPALINLPVAFRRCLSRCCFDLIAGAAHFFLLAVAVSCRLCGRSELTFIIEFFRSLVTVMHDSFLI